MPMDFYRALLWFATTQRWSSSLLDPTRYLPKMISGKQHKTIAPTRIVNPITFQPCPPRGNTPSPYANATAAIAKKKGPVR